MSINLESKTLVINRPWIEKITFISISDREACVWISNIRLLCGYDTILCHFHLVFIIAVSHRYLTWQLHVLYNWYRFAYASRVTSKLLRLTKRLNFYNILKFTPERCSLILCWKAGYLTSGFLKANSLSVIDFICIS